MDGATILFSSVPGIGFNFQLSFVSKHHEKVDFFFSVVRFFRLLPLRFPETLPRVHSNKGDWIGKRRRWLTLVIVSRKECVS